MSIVGPPTLEEVVAAGRQRARNGEKVHQGFGFASIAPSPLRERERQDAAEEFTQTGRPDFDEFDDDIVGGEFDVDVFYAEISARIEAAQTRLKRSVPRE